MCKGNKYTQNLLFVSVLLYYRPFNMRFLKYNFGYIPSADQLALQYVNLFLNPYLFYTTK